MKTSELRQIVKEMVKDCITEVLLENKIFSSIIKEIIISTKETILESNSYSTQKMVASPAKKPSSHYLRLAEERNDRDLNKFIKSTENITENIMEGREREERLDNKEMEALTYSETLANQNNVVPLQAIMALMGKK